MTRDELIDKSEKFIQWTDRRIDGVEVPNDLRSRLASGALAMVLEHQKAIVLLIARNLHGAAFALIRLIFEAYVRAIWLQRCASELELQKFQKDKVPKFAELVVAVEKLEAFEGATFSRAKARGWTAMNSLHILVTARSCVSKRLRRLRQATTKRKYWKR